MAHSSPNDSLIISNDTEFNTHCDDIKNIQRAPNQLIADTMLYSDNAHLLVKVIIPIIFVIGLFGNTAFFLMIAKVKKMRTATNFYLANLAAADILALILETFFRSWRYIASVVVWHHPFHTNFGCRMYHFATNLLSSASIFLITLVTFDRYFAICHPIKYRNLQHKHRVSFVLVVLVWIITLILSFPSIPSFGKLIHICIKWPAQNMYVNFPNVARRCTPTHQIFREIANAMYSSPFIVSMIINTITNIRVVYKLILRQCPGENGVNKDEKIKRRITWMLTANTTIFFCCLAPGHALILGQNVTFLTFLHPSGPQIKAHLFLIVFTLRMVNSAINPILYGVASPSYRRGFLRAFGFLKNQVEPNNTIQENARRTATQEIENGE